MWTEGLCHQVTANKAGIDESLLADSLIWWQVGERRLYLTAGSNEKVLRWRNDRRLNHVLGRISWPCAATFWISRHIQTLKALPSSLVPWFSKFSGCQNLLEKLVTMFWESFTPGPNPLRFCFSRNGVKFRKLHCNKHHTGRFWCWWLEEPERWTRKYSGIFTMAGSKVIVDGSCVTGSGSPGD